MIVRLIAACCFFVIANGSVQAEEPRKAQIFAGAFFPFILEQDNEGTPRGLSVDILERISALTGDPIEVKVYPWARAQQLLKQGTVNGLVGPYRSAERDGYMTYSNTHFYEDRMVLLQRKDKPVPWDGDFRSMSSYSILTINGWAYGPEFDAARPLLRTEKVATAAQALLMLRNDQVDLVALNERNALYEIRKEAALEEIEIKEPEFRTVVGYFAFPRENTDHAFQKRFNDALDHLAATGEINQLSARYGLSYIGRVTN
ncbi:transporter substrate-binding domain-containing protein [Kiloniella laminariae]|uniref:Transporter substrate-binding domain-containing protein n=1 Tax=Kiloniella laminariae TaxID=454162 RepID=A0ABT4LI12_9PROT|nr:transporter substrate-binding domain-containing protein [Kiloniella laminariae]MCZ4279642.1 transporter substrate-binding domain-containing protein [Kiloniella laminariae]